MHLARLIFEDLQKHGYDVFLDVNSIDSGEFDRIILNQIAARAHFVLVLSQSSLERCENQNDWLRREIEEAFRLKRNIVPIFDEGFDISAEATYLPDPLCNELPRRNGIPLYHYYFDKAMETLRNRFLKEPVYDMVIEPTPLNEQPEVHRRIAQVTEQTDIASKDRRIVLVKYLLPPPFEWVDIPGADVILEMGGYVDSEDMKTQRVEPFRIARYPITNAQYRVFVEAGGYTRPELWTGKGWKIKESKHWDKPRYWKDTRYNQPDHPVTGISWYEMIAFCRWLSEETNESITLPTEQQWQRTAQGDDNTVYPWGNEFDTDRCNTKESGLEKTTPVTHYLEGASPYGVMDMSGNVSERCLNDWNEPEVDVDKDTDRRVVRGGSFYRPKEYAQTTHREFGAPDNRNNRTGFRVCAAIAPRYSNRASLSHIPVDSSVDEQKPENQSGADKHTEVRRQIAQASCNPRSWLNEPCAIIIAAIITGIFTIISVLIVGSNQKGTTPTVTVIERTNSPSVGDTVSAIPPPTTIVADAIESQITLFIDRTSLIIYAPESIPLNGLVFQTADDEIHSLFVYADLRFFLDPNPYPVCLFIRTNNDVTPLPSECADPTVVARTVIHPADVFWWNENQICTQSLKVLYEGQYVGQCSSDISSQQCQFSVKGN